MQDFGRYVMADTKPADDKVYKDLMTMRVVCKHRENIKTDEIEKEMYGDWEDMLSKALDLLEERKFILELIDTMIADWSEVKTWAGACKRTALEELKTIIIRRRNKKNGNNQ